MRRCKKCTHKISFWKYLTVWRPVLPLFPRTQMPPVCSPSWAPCRGCWKVSGCSDWFNPCRGRWQGLLFSRSVVSDSLRPHGLQHARPPCPSPPPGTCSNSCPSSQWCHPTLSSHRVSDAIRPSHPIESVMPSDPLILCRPLLPSSIFPSIRVFSNGSVLRIRWPKVFVADSAQVPFPTGWPGMTNLRTQGREASYRRRQGRKAGRPKGVISAKSQPHPDLCSMLGYKQHLRGFFCVCLPKGQGAGRVYLPLFSHRLHGLGLEDILGVESQWEGHVDS